MENQRKQVKCVKLNMLLPFPLFSILVNNSITTPAVKKINLNSFPFSGDTNKYIGNCNTYLTAIIRAGQKAMREMERGTREH